MIGNLDTQGKVDSANTYYYCYQNFLTERIDSNPLHPTEPGMSGLFPACLPIPLRRAYLTRVPVGHLSSFFWRDDYPPSFFLFSDHDMRGIEEKGWGCFGKKGMDRRGLPDR